MPNRLTRRDFLKAGALAATASVISGCTVDLQRTEFLESYIQPPEEELPGENLWYASTCRQCAAGCGIIARTSAGRVRKIEGNPLHPLNQGKLCARGQAALQELYDPDRLRSPVGQVAGRGSAEFDPLYWEDALAVLMNKLDDASPEGVAFLGGNLSTHLGVVVRRFLDGLGAPAPLSYTMGDELEGRQALAQTGQALFGAPAIPMYDIARADVVFSFGANFLETWLSPVGYGRAYGLMRRQPLGKRGYLVQFEPRYSSTAACADEWVPLQPGTDGLVALALGKIILEQQGGRLPAAYEGVDVGAVAVASGVSSETLEHLAHVLTHFERPVAIPGAAVVGQRDGLSAVRAVQSLNQILGRLGQAGGVFLPAATAVEGFASPPLATFAELQDLVRRMASGLVRVLFIHGANPIFELPRALGFSEALANVPAVVSFNSTVDETAVQADLILPDHTSLEGWGYHVPPLSERLAISGQQPVTRPLYDTRATADVLLALAQRAGGSLAQVLPWRNEVEFLKEITGAWRPDGMSTDAFWSTWRRQGGWWPEGEAWRAPEPTAAFDQPLTLAAPAFEGEPPEYPYTLFIYPSIALFDGRGANKSWLQETPDPMTTVAWQTWIEIHPDTAKDLGVEDGDLVLVRSRSGGLTEVEALVYVYPGIRRDVVAMPVGRGHDQYGRFARGQGSNPVKLLVPAVDGETGGLCWCATRVRIEPTGKRKALARLESPTGIKYVQEEE